MLRERIGNHIVRKLPTLTIEFSISFEGIVSKLTKRNHGQDGNAIISKQFFKSDSKQCNAKATK